MDNPVLDVDFGTVNFRASEPLGLNILYWHMNHHAQFCQFWIMCWPLPIKRSLSKLEVIPKFDELIKIARECEHRSQWATSMRLETWRITFSVVHGHIFVCLTDLYSTLSGKSSVRVCCVVATSRDHYWGFVPLDVLLEIRLVPAAESTHNHGKNYQQLNKRSHWSPYTNKGLCFRSCRWRPCSIKDEAKFKTEIVNRTSSGKLSCRKRFRDSSAIKRSTGGSKQGNTVTTGMGATVPTQGTRGWGTLCTAGWRRYYTSS